MKSKHIIIFVTILIPFLYGCSSIDWYNVYDQCYPCKGDVYVCKCDSGSFDLYLGSTITLRMFGPPLIPFFPIHPENPKNIYVIVEPIYDSLNHAFDSLSFALRPKGSNVLIKPKWADPWGRVPYIGIHSYVFNIGGYSPDTLEVVFLKKYLGCKLPIVTFIANNKMKYEPLEIQ